MSVEMSNLFAIVGMALATWATRLAGLGLLGLVGRNRVLVSALDAVPVAVLTAVIAPSIVNGGPATTIAAAVTVIAAIRLPLLATVIIGVASVVVLRMLLA